MRQNNTESDDDDEAEVAKALVSLGSTTTN